MKKFEVQDLIVFTGIYGFLSLLTWFFITDNGLSIWMGINVGFAMVPLVVIVFLYHRFLDNLGKIDWVLIIGLVIYLFFYPNAFYILTDFMHIDSSDFYYHEVLNDYFGSTNTVYSMNIEPFFILIHIIVSAIVGAYAGIQSLLYLEEMFNYKYKNKILTSSVVVVMLTLSSLGIYLGRFLRFFSFDILRPFHLLNTFFDSIVPFTFQFVIIFTLLEMIIYYGYKILIIKIPNEDFS